jgi:hypothetical protein
MDQKVNAFALLFPSVKGKRFDDLVSDIKKHGLINPIVKHEGEILDGRNRLRACAVAHVTPRFVEFSSLGLKCTPAEYIWSANIERRQLTADQRTALAFAWAGKLRVLAKQHQSAKDTAGSPIRTRKAIAERAGVTEHKARQIETVAKLAPKLVKKIASGSVKLRDAVKKVKRPARKVSVMRKLHYGKGIARVLNALSYEIRMVQSIVDDKPKFYAGLSRTLHTVGKRISKLHVRARAA